MFLGERAFARGYLKPNFWARTDAGGHVRACACLGGIQLLWLEGQEVQVARISDYLEMFSLLKLLSVKTDTCNFQRVVSVRFESQISLYIGLNQAFNSCFTWKPLLSFNCLSA